jgi:hypothetical protein
LYGPEDGTEVEAYALLIGKESRVVVGLVKKAPLGDSSLAKQTDSIQ